MAQLKQLKDIVTDENIYPMTTSEAVVMSNGKTAEESLEAKVDKVVGKDLSTNDYTDADKTKIDQALLVAPQTLTGEQKSQTRTNMGILTMTQEEYDLLTEDEKLNSIVFIKD